jgi:PAS domain S-box-containing protein
MQSPTLPPDEATRLEALRKLGVLDTPPGEAFDAIARAASLVCGMPIALISLVDGDRQWFKANVGLTGVTQTDRDVSFCGHAILQDGVFEVSDAAEDARFADNPLVTGGPKIRHYAGAPLRLSDGSQVGSLCVIGREPGRLDEKQSEILTQLSRAAAQALENFNAAQNAQQNALALAKERQRLASVIEGTGVGTWEWNVRTGEFLINDRWLPLLGRSAMDRETLLGMIHPEDRPRAEHAMAEHLAGRRPGYLFDGRMQHSDGRWIWMFSRGAIVTRTTDGSPEWISGTISDNTETRMQQEALRKSERFLAQTERFAGVGGWEIDLATGALQWTPQAFRIAGLDPSRPPTAEQAIGFYAPEARDRVIAARERAIATGEAYDLEVPYVRADGARIWVRSFGNAVFAGGRAVRMAGAFQDITAQVEQRLALEQARTRVQLATDSGGIGVWDWNIVTDDMYWDDWMCRLYDIERPDGRGTFVLWKTLLHAADRAAAERAIRDAVDGTRPLDTEFRVVWTDGSVHYLRAFGRVIRDADGRALHMVGTNWDVTEQHRLTAELAEQHELLRVTLQSIGEAVITTDAHGRVAWMNPVAERLTGWPAAEAVSKPLTEICRIFDEETRAPKRDLVSVCLAQGRVVGQDGNTLLVSRYGREFGIEDTVSPIRNDQGDILGVIKVFHDVTKQRRLEAERREHEQQLLVANKELERLARHMAKSKSIAEQASRAKTRFLAGMSHELRTPLNGILGYAQLLRMDGGLSGVQAERVQAMLSAGTHLLEMISCVLDLSEIETGGVELQKAPVDLASLAEASLNIVRPTAETKRLGLGLAVMSDVPRRVMTDPSRLRQVLLNLLGNAVKYTQAGSVELRVRTARQSAPEAPRLRFEVADTGPGIPPEQHHLLFEEFERLDAKETGKEEGAGLGLSLAKQLAGVLGGALGHEDNPGGGSIFWLEIPLVADAAGSAAPARASDFAQAEPDEPVAGPAAGGARVLVVDDVAMNRDIAAAFIRSAGYEVVCAEGGAEAVAAVEAAEFLVVLMDVRMPEIDGLEATRRIRSLAAPRRQVPIVALTAQVFTEQIEACRQAGMDTHVAKPFTLETLLGAIKRGVAVGQERAPRPPVANDSAPAPEPAPGAGLGMNLPVLDAAAMEKTSAMLKPEAVQTYLSGLATRMEALQAGLRSFADAPGGTGKLVEAAHALAGSAGMFGFERLVLVARHFERSVKADPSVAAALAGDLTVALELSLAALQARTGKARQSEAA